jgi:hypothetical protein
MAILCTEDDKLFEKYKENISNRKVKFHIKDIFKDHWNNFLNKYPNFNIRQTVFDNIKRMLKCKTLDLGFDVFKCPNCGKEKFYFHTCKSRLCSSCGNKYNNQRQTSIFSKLFKFKHRHIVWTIPKELRRYFREDRKRLSLLFKASQIVIESWFCDKYKKKNITPGFISILHTYGRSLIWNPHIHMILLEGGMNKDGFVTVNFFAYAAFRKRFMKVLLDLLDEEINTNEFKQLKRQLYKELQAGFYVFSPPSKFKSIDGLIKYVTRYVSRPVMAESRILDYDGTYVTFWYQRHEDNKIVVEKIHAFEFISRIILHIPEKNQKYIRYYGCYNESTKLITTKIKEMFRLCNTKSIELKRAINKWRLNIQVSFYFDPLKCPKCDTIMVYTESVW